MPYHLGYFKSLAWHKIIEKNRCYSTKCSKVGWWKSLDKIAIVLEEGVPAYPVAVWIIKEEKMQDSYMQASQIPPLVPSRSQDAEWVKDFYVNWKGKGTEVPSGQQHLRIFCLSSELASQEQIIDT